MRTETKCTIAKFLIVAAGGSVLGKSLNIKEPKKQLNMAAASMGLMLGGIMVCDQIEKESYGRDCYIDGLRKMSSDVTRMLFEIDTKHKKEQSNAPDINDTSTEKQELSTNEKDPN